MVSSSVSGGTSNRSGQSAALMSQKRHSEALLGRLQAEHPDRFSEAQLQTMQHRVNEWRGIMAKELVYAGTAEPFAEPDVPPELALVGGDPRCYSFGNIIR